MNGEFKKVDKDLNFPPDSGMKNFGPSGGQPPDVDPGKKPPFPIGPPIGGKPENKPSTGSGKGGKKK